ncbi:hypothetical protein LUZ60_005835 [Juncus effusus]|nr:hypothetical protein LUZ60_005835 [Juncus effusus]
MHLSHFLSNHGFKITFVNTEQNQNIISANHENMFDQIRAISISDGLSSEENRLTYKLFLSLEKNMPMQLEQVIQEINEKEEEKITILIADCGMAWTFEVAGKMGLQAVAFCSASGAHLAVSYLSISKFMEDGVIDENTQGHVIPMMHLAHSLSNHGFQITFINTESNHNRIQSSSTRSDNQFNMISVPDGLASVKDRNDLGELTEALQKGMAIGVEEVIRKSEGGIDCLVVDQGMGWTVEIARKMDLKVGIFWPASGSVMATILSIPKLIEDGVIDTDGKLKNQESFQISSNAPVMDATHLAWNYIGDSKTQKIMFHYMKNNAEKTSGADFILCNSSRDFEPAIYSNFPNLLPIGPLPIDKIDEPSLNGHFWPEDKDYISWLDKQESNSVIYIAFGSISTLNPNQFQELALGLEMTRMPFLWVTRPGLTDTNSDNFFMQFKERVKGRGIIVDWCNQEKVLAHHSIACFVSHCGWNSTMEGVKNGVHFLCWPYFGDQFVNQGYICDLWKVGLRLIENDNGIVTKERVNLKLKQLISDDRMKMRAEEMKKMVRKCATEGGSSFENLNRFIESMKKEKKA